MHKGSCLCGKVSFKITDEIFNVIACSCHMCQKMSGSAFIAFGGSRAMTIFGDEFIQTYSSSDHAQRSFCGACGSTLFWADAQTECAAETYFALGLLDTNFKPKTITHLYSEQRPAWFHSI